MFSMLFFALIPILILYTSGYRLSDDLRLVKTGGIYVNSPMSGTEIYINNKPKKETGIFQKDYFVQNLKPGTYYVFVSKDGYLPWSKEMHVEEQIVSEGFAFMVPKSPTVVEVPKFLTDTTGSVGTSSKINTEYTTLLSMFAPAKKQVTATSFFFGTTTPTIKKSAPDSIVKNDVEIWKEENKVYARWLGEPTATPYFFCTENKRTCFETSFVFESKTKIQQLDFYPQRNDVIIISLPDGLYAMEMDKRTPQNFQLIYKASNPDFRIVDGSTIAVKDGASLFEVSIEK